jgi:hypothetical protein
MGGEIRVDLVEHGESVVGRNLRVASASLAAGARSSDLRSKIGHCRPAQRSAEMVDWSFRLGEIE